MAMSLLGNFFICFSVLLASLAIDSAPSTSTKNQQKIPSLNKNSPQAPYYPESPFTEVLFTEGGAFNGDGYLPEQDGLYYYRNPGQFVAEAYEQRQPDEQQPSSELPEVLYARAMFERAKAKQKQMLMNEALQREAAELEEQEKLADLAEARRRAALISATVQQRHPAASEVQKRWKDRTAEPQQLRQRDYFVQTEQDQQPSSEQGYDEQLDLEGQHDARNMEEIADENLARFGMALARATTNRQIMESGEQYKEKNNAMPGGANTKAKSERKITAQKELPVAVIEPKGPPKVPAKKGQYEFVEFVEPHPSGKLRGIEIMEKRVPTGHYSDQGGSPFNLFLNTGNLLFLAAIAMCCMMAATVTAGGVYYYKRMRTSHDDPFDEFMRYSPTGPGRDKLKKAHLPPSRQSPTGGDDTLAYRAQLQHYRQTKQRIIGGPCGFPPDHIVVPAVSDDEDDDELDKHNFSVYECPGLAPTTGDIEVQNPNFVGSAGGSSGRRGSGSVKSPSPAPSQGSDRLDE